MRFYRIEISGGTEATYTSLVNGQVDPGALNIELDVPGVFFADPMGAALVRVWGISLQTVSQASDFNGADIKVYAGMSKGLPLATPSQQGLILKGVVQQAFGNWVGVDMTLDLIVVTGAAATQTAPANITFTWAKGTKLADMIAQVLTQAYSDYKQDIKIDDTLVLTEDETGVYTTIEQFSLYLQTVSKSINTDPNYLGVQVTVVDQTFVVTDGTVAADVVKQIAFNDLVGQPTWIGPNQVQFNCVMRADINVANTIQFPQTQVTSTQAELGQQPQDKSSFSGKFGVSLVRHVGNFRQPDAQSWISTFNAYVISPPPAPPAA